MQLSEPKFMKKSLASSAFIVVAVITILFISSFALLTTSAASVSHRTVMGYNAATSGSYNWSGYVVTGGINSVSGALGSWTVPTVTCASGENSYSSFWVGIDGFQSGSNTVEQIGTDSDCASGIPTYYSWYSFYPYSSSIVLTSVHPGDVIVASVYYLPKTSLFAVVLKDMTTGKLYGAEGAVPGALRNSADFITEAPYVCSTTGCTLAPLSNFGTVGFGQSNTNIKYTGSLVLNDIFGPIGSFPSAQSIQMVSQSNTNLVKAQPSAILNGNSFTVTWMNAGP